jgi:hypothetical protein
MFSRIREDIREKSLTLRVLSAENQKFILSYHIFLYFSSKSRVVMIPMVELLSKNSFRSSDMPLKR